MSFKALITGILALVYCVAAHFFVTSYTQYHIQHNKLGLLRGQARFLRTQASMLAEKKYTLEVVQDFVRTTRHQGLTPDKWDTFFVEIDNSGLTFDKLETILNQTATSEDYYFIPTFLGIRTGSKKSERIRIKEPVPGASASAQTSRAGSPAAPGVTSDQSDSQTEANLTSSDAVISIEGHFLVRRRGENG